MKILMHLTILLGIILLSPLAFAQDSEEYSPQVAVTNAGVQLNSDTPCEGAVCPNKHATDNLILTNDTTYRESSSTSGGAEGTK